jgi:hypothetical protein
MHHGWTFLLVYSPVSKCVSLRHFVLDVAVAVEARAVAEAEAVA